MKLRPYQLECLQSILEGYRRGLRRQLVCLPTGTGKTVIFAEFPRFFRMKNQMLVLAHREELLDQARDKLLRSNPALKVEIEQAHRNASPDCDVVVASVPTLGRQGSSRLQHLDPDRFYLIIVDEAHHAPAASYRRILEHFDLFSSETRKLLVGFTATPKRGDGVGLDKIFQEIIYSKRLPEMINAGYLSPVTGFRVETEVDLSRIRTRMGDFVTGQLSEAVNIASRNEIVVDVYRQKIPNSQTLCFCVDVAHAHAVADQFNIEGIPAAAVTGDMDRSERSRILKDFREHKINVLANCMVLTEGYDEPSITGIILARPTKSALLYTQMIGRGTRLHPGKEAVCVIDIVDVTRDHKLSTLPSLFGLTDSFNMAGRTTREVEKAIRWAEKNRPWVPVHRARNLDDLRYRCQRIDLLDLETPDEIEEFTRYSWVSIGQDSYRLGLPHAQALVIGRTILDKWEVSLTTKNEDETLAVQDRLDEAFLFAENWIRRELPYSVGLVNRQSRWRFEPVSEKQLSLLNQFNLEIPTGLTKGQASHIISMLR